METFGSLLRRYRLARNMSQAALAEVSDISVAAVAAYERGVRSAPHPETLRRITDSLGLAETARREFEQAGRRKKRALAPRPTRANTADPDALPFESTTFLGREQELDDLVARLRRYRLVTITGAGGIGKTRLALRAAQASLSALSVTTCFVDLSGIETEDTLYRRVSSALGITVSSSLAEFSAYVAMLTERSALLVLDNCEHLIHDVGLLVKSILERAPGMRVLLTSRKRSAIQGEGVFRLSPLAVPSSLPASVEEARQYAAIALFEERAHGADQTFVLSERQIEVVADICGRLDGMPLAIELAAAKVPVFGLNGLQLHLRERLADLGTSATDLPPRQRSLRAMIKWSCLLIDDTERHLFYRLSAFGGVFCIEDAENICSDDADSPSIVVDALGSLVEHSLVACDYRNEPPLYRMLESLREFGREMLDDVERVRLSDRHARWYSTLADKIERSQMTLPPAEWSARYQPRTNDILQAIDWAISRNDFALAGNIIGGVRTLWLRALRWSEGATLADRVLKRIDRIAYPAITAKLLLTLVCVQYDTNTADQAQEAVRLREALGDTYGLVACYLNLAYVYCRAGNLEYAERAVEKASTAARTVGLEAAYPSVAFLKSLILLLSKRYGEARDLLEQSLSDCDFRNDIWSWMMRLLAEINAYLGATRAAADIAVAMCDRLRDATTMDIVFTVTEAIGYLALDGDPGWAQLADEMLNLATKQGFNLKFIEGLSYIAYAFAVDGALCEAALLSGFVEHSMKHRQSTWYGGSEISLGDRLGRALAVMLDSAMTQEERTRCAREGSQLDFASIVKRTRLVVSRHVAGPRAIAVG